MSKKLDADIEADFDSAGFVLFFEDVDYLDKNLLGLLIELFH